jgi:two-component system NtrC family sensor kinase
MFISLKTKIWMTVFSIVLMFTFFTLYYFPRRQGDFLLKNYKDEIQNFANTVALGVQIALKEDDFEGVQTAMSYVKGNADLKFISLIQTDTSWNVERTKFTTKETVLITYPDSIHPSVDIVSSDSLIVKKAPFHSSLMSGNVLLTFTNNEINESKKNIRITSLLVSSGIFLIGIIIGLWLSRNISVPVIKLRNAARRVGEGDLTQTIEIYSNDEVGELSKAFNQMVKGILKTREELKSSNENLSATNQTLNNTLNDLRATQTQLIQSEKMASLGELTAGIAHEIQNPLNFVNNFSEVNIELIDEMKNELAAGNEKQAISLAEDIKENEQKILQHGQRADVIVKGMLQHSRISTGKKEPTDINTLIDAYMHLAYHGIRAKNKSLNVILQTDLDADIGKINVVPQEIGRVLLNLYNNALYAISEKQKSVSNTTDNSYEPKIYTSTRKGHGKIEIHIKDNGIGISRKILDKIFLPFFTTKPSGQGPGLGLSLSYDIIKAHGGEIKVEMSEGEGAGFIIQLPIV